MPEAIRKFILALVIAIIATGILYSLSTRTQILAPMERGMTDVCFRLREPEHVEDLREGNRYVSERSQLFEIDEESIAVVGKWPWKRYVHADFLRKIERFSPESVMFDVLFITGEAVPQFINQRVALDAKSQAGLEQAFTDMDEELARALAEYDNVYLDLQLVEQGDRDIPKEYQARIERVEQRLRDYSWKAEAVRDAKEFKSLEPVLDTFITNAHPGIINVAAGADGTIRAWPLYYTYYEADSTTLNVPTVVLLLLQRYYHISREQVSLEKGQVVLKQAKVPELDPTSHQPRVTTLPLSELISRIVNPSAPATYSYDKNLLHFMVNDHIVGTQTKEKVPRFPLHVLVKDSNELEILDSWEVLDAGRQIGSEQVQVITYHQRDLIIPTPVPAPEGNAFYINYAGSEETTLTRRETGGEMLYRPIPTESYYTISVLPELPDLPLLNTSGSTETGGIDRVTLETWFFDFCSQRAQRTMDQAMDKLGEKVNDGVSIWTFVNEFPEERKYLPYFQFMAQLEVKPGGLADVYEHYKPFGEAIGQDSGEFLSDKQMISALMAFYRDNYSRYYNKFVFTGGTALGAHDVRQTPYKAMTGISVIINAFNTIVTNNQIQVTRSAACTDLIALLGICVLASLAYTFVSARAGAFVFFSIIAGTAVVVIGLFYYRNVVLTSVPLFFGNTLVFVGVWVYKLLTEERDKKFLHQTFGNYLAPELIDDMYKNRAVPELGGEARNVTAYFTDIKGFSSFSEILTAHQVVELLNEYLSVMTDTLIADRGTLDKYEGDAIIAFFGAPMDVPDHAFRACRVAIQMQKELDCLRAKWTNEMRDSTEPNRNTKNLALADWGPTHKWPLIVHGMRMRIGINTGEIVVGNMGSTMRMNYTMMGDPVNLAARLEGAAKQYGVYTLVSRQTLDQQYKDSSGNLTRVGDQVEARFLDTIMVVGRTEPVRIYELCALKGELTEREERLLTLFDEAMSHYLAMEWDPAVAVFQEALALERFPSLGMTPSSLYIARCEQFKKIPPAPSVAEWDGVFRLTSKG